MDNQNWNLSTSQQQVQAQVQPVAKSFLSNVFAWMGIALGISALTAWVFGNDASYMQYLLDAATQKPTGLGFIVMLAPLGLVLLMSFGFQRLSSTALIAIFLVYSVLMGMSLSFIFLRYTTSSIYGVFIASAGMFGLMALVGYTTKTDLTKLGNILIMGLIGIIIAGLVNLFLGSPSISYAISFLAVVIFTGLTAYDVQKLKNIGSGVEYGTESAAKLSILGALTLYLDFINLFLALLRLFGGRRN